MGQIGVTNFDLIVFDLSTPQLEGVETIKIIRQLEEFSGQRTQIFGLGEEKDNAELQKKGFDAYIERPVSKEKILQQLEVFEVAG